MADFEENRAAASDRVALFIDVDNILILAQSSGLPFHLSLIIDRARQQGTVMSSKAYADWTANLLRPVLGDFRANAIELVQLPTSTASKEHKNTADIQLTVDAFEMVFLPRAPRHHRNRGRRPRLRAPGPEAQEVRRVSLWESASPPE